MRFFWFMSYCPAGPPLVMWDHPANRGFDYLDLGQWLEMAKELERGKFDGIFWADHTAIHDVYMGPEDVYPRDTAIREAVQFPILDPSYLVPAMASVTSDLGFIISSNVIAHHPFVFAREMTTLDHITNGRIGWNIVTSFQHSAWQNTGQGEVAQHSNRYARAEEYTQVVYRLLEGSWDEDAVVRDYENRVYADPRKVHDIEPVAGMYEHVIGPHVSEPSTQRVPFLFQAGSSGDGRAFAARNAEAMFQAPPTPKIGKRLVDDIHERMAASGRERDDAIVTQNLQVVVAGTEEEAKRKDAELVDYLSHENYKSFFSSTMNFDLGSIELDKPLGDFETNALQGHIKEVIDSMPNKELSFRDYYLSAFNGRFVGTGEQLADHLEEWYDVGVRGVNLHILTGQADLKVFNREVAPVLRERGLMQAEYGPYRTLREKLFDGAQGPKTNGRHPSAVYRNRPEVAA
jgi:FMN-dependent oxidoreductase (nitrilotriacetate monooxygenase family)